MGAQLGLSAPGGIGGTPNIDVPTFAETKPSIKSGYGLQTAQLNKFAANQPLLQRIEQGALGLPNVWQPSQQELRAVDQSTLAKEAAAGTAHTTGSIGRQVLGEDQYQIQRAGQILGLQEGAEASKVGSFATVTNPILGFISNLLGQQTQANIAEQQIGSQNAISSAQIQNQAFGDWINSMATVAGGALKMSDERLKTKIKKTGRKSEEGIPLKTFEYKTRPGVRFLGPMAQDVEQKVPDAVITDPISGIKIVNFSKLKSPMLELLTGKAD